MLELCTSSKRRCCVGGLLLSAFTACRFTRLRLLWVLGAFTSSTTLLSRRRFASVRVHRLSVYAALAVVGSGGFASSTTLLSRRRFASVRVHRLSVCAALAAVGSGGFQLVNNAISCQRVSLILANCSRSSWVVFPLWGLPSRRHGFIVSKYCPFVSVEWYFSVVSRSSLRQPTSPP